jgi:hypothetical protein
MSEVKALTTQSFDTAKHIDRISDLVILLAMMREEPTIRRENGQDPIYLVDGVRIADSLKRFHVDMDYRYIRKRHLAKHGLYGTRKDGTLMLPKRDRQITAQVDFLCQAIRDLSDRNTHCTRVAASVGNYYTWMPSSFGERAIVDDVIMEHERQREESKGKEER